METIKKLDTNDSQFFDHHDTDIVKWLAHRTIKY
jgi:2,5-diketo-D-gluconate reductase A